MLAALIVIPNFVFAVPVAPPRTDCQQRGGVLVDFCCPKRGLYEFNFQPNCIINGENLIITSVAPVLVTGDNPNPKECGAEWEPDRGTRFALCKIDDSYVKFNYITHT
jgi:hypothetical protein